MAEGANTNGRSFQQILHDFGKSFTNTGAGAFTILLIYSTALHAPIRLCIEAKIFQQLAKSSQPLSVRQLIEHLNANSDSEQDISDREEFVGRMIVAASALNLVDEVSTRVYRANELTRSLADPGFEAGYVMLYDTLMGPHSTNQHMLSWAKNNGWKAPETSTDGPYQQARGIVGTTTFEDWTKINPEHMSNLSKLMSKVQKDRLNWSEWFPSEAIFGSEVIDPEKPFLVDVGGGYGHDLSAFAKRYPDKKMRLILEDQPEVIAEAQDEQNDPRVELVEHNFFKPQPIKGASIYFMHKIMHDWPEKDCITILSHLRDAMAPNSRLFLNDAILPDQGSPLIFAAFDMTMLAELSAKERSESMWSRLVNAVGGLEVKKFWQAPELKGEGIVEVVKSI